MNWKKIEIPLKKPFKIALGTTTKYEGVILKICVADYCGYGEASPSPRITGDTVDSIISSLRRFKINLIGKNPLEIGKIMNELNKDIIHNSSAKAAVDMALYDLLGKRANLPVRNILGGEKDKIETSLTVSIGKIPDTIKDAENLLDKGAKILKIKIGLNPQEDIERIHAIRKITDAKIRVDGNQGYSLKMAIKVLRAIERYEIEFAEQPIPRNEIENLRILREKTEIPIMADEAVHNSQDLINLIGKVDAINIKLMKSGGIYEAMKMASIAKAARMKVMVGCMIETKLGITSGTQFALGVGADYADLDGYFDLKTQPFEGVIYKDGYNLISDEPGLGVRSLVPSDVTAEKLNEV